MVKFGEASWLQVKHCAKYAGLDDILDIYNRANRNDILRRLIKMGYVAIDASDPDWIVPVRVA